MRYSRRVGGTTRSAREFRGCDGREVMEIMCICPMERLTAGQTNGRRARGPQKKKYAPGLGRQQAHVIRRDDSSTLADDLVIPIAIFGAIIAISEVLKGVLA